MLTDECRLHQCALKPLECIRSNWSEPASGSPSDCSSMKWLPRRYEERISVELRASNSTNSSYNQTSTNRTNGTSTALVVAKKEPLGFLVHDPGCDEHAEWSVFVSGIMQPGFPYVLFCGYFINLSLMA
jgi:hypothetical protein